MMQYAHFKIIIGLHKDKTTPCFSVSSILLLYEHIRVTANLWFQQCFNYSNETNIS